MSSQHDWVEEFPERLERAKGTEAKLAEAQEFQSIMAHMDSVKKQVIRRGHRIPVRITIGDMPAMEHKVDVFSAAKLSWQVSWMERRHV